MNWINPSLLGFLAAVGIPLLIYLLSKRKLPKIFFSSLRFLKALEKKENRRIKITQWLLIILRMLAILCIVLAFARPLIIGAVPVGTLAESDWAIVLDRSASMNTFYGNATAYDQCVQFIQVFLNSLKKNDNVALFFADQLDTAQVLNNALLIQNSLEGSSPLSIVDNLQLGLTRAETHLAKSNRPFRAILVLTDGVGTPDTINHPFVNGIQYFLWIPQHGEISNFSIEDLKLSEPFLNADIGAKISFQIRSNDEGGKPLLIKISVKSEDQPYQPVGETTIELLKNATQSMEWSVPLTGSGPWIIRVEHFNNDVLRTDNFAELYLPQAPLQAVSISGDFNERNSLERILRVSNISIQNRYDPKLLHIHSGKLPPPENPEIWKTRLENGGRLWLIPSPNADLMMWNTWLQTLAAIQLSHYESNPFGYYHFDVQDLKNLLSNWVKEPRGATNGRWIVRGGTSPIRFQDGNPIWSEAPIQNGFLRIQSIPISGTNFETEPIQLPLFFKGIQMLQRNEPIPISEAGFEVTAPLQYELFSQWISPTGKRLISTNRKFLFPEIGFWRNDSNQVWSIVFPKRESDFTQRTNFGGIPKKDFHLLPNDYASAIQKIHHLRDGRELRMVFLSLALGLLLAEGLIGRGSRSEKE